MKRILCFILALCLMLSTFAGCGKKDVSGENSDTSKDNIENIHSDTDKTDIGKVDMSIVSKASPFKNGIAIVQYDYNDKLTDWKYLFIDKTGNILFETKDYYCDMNAPITSNGIVLLQSREQGGEYVACDIKANKIYTASDLGGTNIVCDRFTDAFADGYILVENIETTYDGSTKTLAIYNEKFEMLCPFSKEMYDFALQNGYSQYNNGYILNDIYPDEYIDIQGGTMGKGTSQLQLEPDYNLVRDNLTRKYDTLIDSTEFSGNYSGVIFQSEDNYYCSVADINGDLTFEPMQINYIHNITSQTLNGDNGKYVCSSLDKANNNFHIEIFDTKGITGTIDIPVQYTGTVNDRYSCLYGDETVVVEVHSKDTVNICYYNMDGTKLF